MNKIFGVIITIISIIVLCSIFFVPFLKINFFYKILLGTILITNCEILFLFGIKLLKKYK